MVTEQFNRPLIPCLSCGASGEYAPVVMTTGAHMYHGNAGQFTFRRCRHCDLIWLNPPLPPEELGEFYPDYYLPYRGAAAWGRFKHLAARGMAATDVKRVRRVVSLLPQDGTVLDVGCGQPSFLWELYRRNPGISATGIDFVDTGWRDDQAKWEGIELVVSDPADYERPEPVDLITMWHYLEHDYHPVETLQRMKTFAHAQTRLLIEVPHVNSLSRWWFGTHWEGWHAPRHTALYSRKTLAETLRRGGWRVVRYSTRGTLDTFALWWMSAMERRGIDWRQSLGRYFPAFLLVRVLSAPLFMLEGLLPLGVQIVEAVPEMG